MTHTVRRPVLALAAALVALAGTLVTSTVGADEARAEGEDYFAFHANLTGYVRGSDGIAIPVPVAAGAPLPALGADGLPMFDAGGMPIMKQTYIADVPPQLFGSTGLEDVTDDVPSPGRIELQWTASANEASECKTNDSVTVRSCITMYYSEATIAQRYHVRVHKYVASWKRLDRQVGLSGAAVMMGANGGNHNQHNERWCASWVYKSESSDIGSPGSGQEYTATPSWAGCSVAVQGEGSHTYQVGGPRVTITRGSRTWKFWFNVVKGSL